VEHETATAKIRIVKGRFVRTIVASCDVAQRCRMAGSAASASVFEHSMQFPVVRASTLRVALLRKSRCYCLPNAILAAT